MLRMVPITVTDAKRFVDQWHSHHEPALSALFAAAVAADERIVCVGLLGRPVSRILQDKGVGEITRVASDETKHAASKCVAALSRAAIALGYRRLVSYTLLGERGTSYLAAGWWPTALVTPREWTRPSRERETLQPGAKVRWEFGPDREPLDAELAKFVEDSAGKVALSGRAAPKQASLF